MPVSTSVFINSGFPSDGNDIRGGEIATLEFSRKTTMISVYEGGREISGDNKKLRINNIDVAGWFSLVWRVLL